jgi:Leucine-rich repeat (LRR) protein
MRKRIIWIALAAALVLTLLPVAALADDADSDGYNDHDFSRIQAFLETEAGGVKNGDRISPSYDKNDAASWYGVAWSADTEKRAIGITWSDKAVGGSLDLSGCTALTYVLCLENALTSVNVNGCIALTSLRCDFNDISAVDLTGCGALVTLTLSNNALDSLDVSDFPLLRYVYCNSNDSLTTLDISGLTHLEEVLCYGSALTELDLTGCAILELDCSDNSLTELDLTGCAILELDCSDNSLTELDLAGCPITYLYCSGNLLGELDAGGLLTLELLNCSGNALTSLTLTGCSSLTGLDCGGNALASLTLAGCPSLASLDCSGNALTSLDLSGNAALMALICDDNGIASLTPNPDLLMLSCANNALTALDAAACTSLMIFDCTGNPLQSVDAVYSGNAVSLTANGSGYVGLYFNMVTAEMPVGYYALATPQTGEPFVNWTNASNGSAASSSRQYDLATGNDYDLAANFLSLSSSVAGGKIYTGGRVTLTPSVGGGQWSWDHDFFSATFNSPATFTALKAGTSTITYTLGSASVSYVVTVEQSILPSTGQDFAWAWILGGAALAAAAAGLAYRRGSVFRSGRDDRSL